MEFVECDLGSLQKVRDVGEMLRVREGRLDLVCVSCCSVIQGSILSVAAPCVYAIRSFRPSCDVLS